jgi:hypothetical protein
VDAAAGGFASLDKALDALASATPLSVIALLI